MALPARVLEKVASVQNALRERGFEGGVRAGAEARVERGLGLGWPELEALLPDGGLPRGAVTELAVQGGAALATSLGLRACRVAQEHAQAFTRDPSWCAFVDPSRTLHAPGVRELGIELDRLLVVQPPLEALSRVVVRLCEAQAFAVLVIDTIGVPAAELDVGLGSWPRVVRRLSLSAEGSGACVVLITDSAARRPLPLPVALRLELGRPEPNALVVRVAKEKHGRVSAPRSLGWQSADELGELGPKFVKHPWSSGHAA